MMASPIRVLDESTINQIAAGEVVEGPVSIVKELIENALDAGANAIRIEIQGGGRQWIRVTDNGCGMTQDDCLLCLERHATSKVRNMEDLAALTTMGFRGEALAAISSVSKMVIVTVPHSSLQVNEQDRGTTLSAEGGKIRSCRSSSGSPGTMIEVASLFYNVPARRHFLKSPQQDQLEILRCITLFALAHPHIAFDFVANDQLVLHLDKNQHHDYAKRITALWSEDWLLGATHFHSTYKEYSACGYLAAPSVSKSNRTGQYLFVNHRPIVSYKMSYAIKEAYGSALDKVKHPQFVVFLELAPHLVDVNVHPQKKEVRFREESTLCDWMTKISSEAIFGSIEKFIPQEDVPSDQKESFISQSLSHSPSPYSLPVANSACCAKPAPSSWGVNFKELTLRDEPFLKQNSTAEQPQWKQESLQSICKYRLIGFFDDTLLIEADPGSEFSAFNRAWDLDKQLFVVNIRAALLRIEYNDCLALLERSEPNLSVQSLLLPVTIEFPYEKACSLMQHIPLLKHLGIGIREFGNNAFVVDQWPLSLDNKDIKGFITELIDSLQESESSQKLPGLDGETKRALARMCCRKNRYLVSHLSLDAAEKILHRLLIGADPLKTPFGQPTLFAMGKSAIMKKFLSKDKV